MKAFIFLVVLSLSPVLCLASGKLANLSCSTNHESGQVTCMDQDTGEVTTMVAAGSVNKKYDFMFGMFVGMFLAFGVCILMDVVRKEKIQKDLDQLRPQF